MPSAPRRVRPAVLLVVMVLTALAVPLVPGIGAVARADGSAVSATGSWYRWLPDQDTAHDQPSGPSPQYGYYDTSASPTVTVSQTQDLVDQIVHVSWSHFAPTSNGDVYFDSVPPVTAYSTANVDYPVAIYECGGTAPTVAPNLNDSTCFNAPIDGVADTRGINNAVFAPTEADGTGAADFHVETAETNTVLNCDATHPCSIVVVPNNGGNQTQDAAIDCNDHTQDFLTADDPLNSSYSQNPPYASTPVLNGWDNCTWADRIVIPLSFAKSAVNCPDVAPQFSAVGSPMLRRGMGQLQAGWCTGANSVNFQYNSTTDEYQARETFLAGGSGALSSSTDVAFVTRPPDAADAQQRAFTYAPIADNAISIGYYVDNVKTGQPMTDLKLDARLVAKLLTQSYQPFFYNCQSAPDRTKPYEGCAPEVSGNPMSIFDDPEFQALNMTGNPNHPSRDYFPSGSDVSNNDVLGGFFPTVLAGNSDLTYELTRWVESDPDAAAFLAGQADPWGMHVNPHYLTSQGAPGYPLDAFQPLDPGWTDKSIPSLRETQGFQSTWNPVSGLDQVADVLVANESTAQSPYGTCSSHPAGTDPCQTNPNIPISFPRVAPENIGVRDLWAVVDNASAAAYDFPTARLVNSGGGAVGPDTDSMAAALADMKTNPDHITQYVDDSVRDPKAYPLTVVDYAMVPTCGLSAAKAGAISSMLTHVADSQNYGVQPGTIAPGLQALTPAQVAQTRAAAAAVSSRACSAAPGDPTVEGHTPAPGRSSGGTPGTTTAAGNDGSGAGAGSTPTGGTDATVAAQPIGSAPTPAARATATPTPTTTPFDVGFKPSGQNGSLTMVLPVMLVVGLAFLVGAPLTWLLTGTAAGRSAVRRLARRR